MNEVFGLTAAKALVPPTTTRILPKLRHRTVMHRACGRFCELQLSDIRVALDRQCDEGKNNEECKTFHERRGNVVAHATNLLSRCKRSTKKV